MAKGMGEMTADQKDKKQSHTNLFHSDRFDLGMTVFG